MALKDYIKSVMNQRGLRSTDVERESGGGVTDGYVTNLTRGKVNPSIEKLKAVAKGLRVTQAELFNAAVDDGSETTWTARELIALADSVVSDPKMARVVRGASKLSDKDLDAVISIIESKHPKRS